MPPLLLPHEDFELLRQPDDIPEVPPNPRVLRAIEAIEEEGDREYNYDLLELTRQRIGTSYLSEYFSYKDAIHRSAFYKKFYRHYFPGKSEPDVGVIFQGEKANTNSMHLIFLRIITGCDAAHDFIDGSVFKNAYTKIKLKKTDKDPSWNFWEKSWDDHEEDFVLSFKEAIIDPILQFCISIKEPVDSEYENLAYALVVIDYLGRGFLNKIYVRTPGEKVGDACFWCLSEFIQSDVVAKRIVTIITEALGVSFTPLASITGKTISTMKDTLIQMGAPHSSIDDPVKITIDATSAAKNNLSLITGIIKGREVQPWFTSDPGLFVGYVEDSLVNQFDAAVCGVVEVVAKEVKSHVFFENQIKFNITFRLKGSVHNMLTSSVYKNDAGITYCKCETFYGIQIDKLYNSGEVCKSKCAESIIEEYAKYKVWTNKDMYKNMFEISLGKQLGDLMISLKHIGDDESKLAVSVDRIMTQFTALASKYVIIDGGTTSALTKSVHIFETISDKINRKKKRKWYSPLYDFLIGSKKATSGQPGPSTSNGFGSSTTRIKSASKLELKNKLKLVGIKITKTIRGKRKYLSRKELENKAILFNKLQNTAKRMKIKIMYKKNRIYKYKTYKRLQKEIKKIKMKMKMKMKMKNKMKNKKMYNSRVKNFNFG